MKEYNGIGSLDSISIDNARKEIEELSIYPQLNWFFQVFDKHATPINGFQWIVTETQKDEENFSFEVNKLSAYYVIGMNNSDPNILISLQSAIIHADFERMNFFHVTSNLRNNYGCKVPSLELTLTSYNGSCEKTNQRLNYGAVLYAKDLVTLETKGGFKTNYDIGLRIDNSNVESLASQVYNDIITLKAKDERREAAKKRLCKYKLRKTVDCFAEGIMSIFR